MQRYLIASFLLATLLFGPFQSVKPADGPVQPTPEAPDASVANGIFLPLVISQKNPVIFGAETFALSTLNFDRAQQADLYWLRNATFSWAAIESQRGVYNWNAVDNSGIINLSSRHFTLVATVKLTPSWAQKISGYACGPIASSAWNDYYNFVYAMVQRYSAPPYNIQYWEFGNEPDVDPSLVPSPDSVFGCWGDINDSYYGGGYFAEMLKRAYPAAKAANPNSKVMVGGLLLDCDPTHPPAAGCSAGKFLEGILRNQGGNYFDIVSFHSYLYDINNKILDEDSPNWSARGGQLVGKVDYLRSLLQQYGLNKQLFLSELSMKWCTNETCPSPTATFYDLQADVAVSSFARSWGLGLLGQTWYTLEDSGWAASGLFDGDTPKPAYYALQFMTEELSGASVGSQLTQYSGLRGYEFRLSSKKVWVLWAPDGATGVQIQRPSGVTKMYDKFGNVVSPIPAQITVTHPIYLEFP